MKIRDEKSELSIIQSYPFFFHIKPSQVDIISDIDDTILVSHTLNHFKRILTTLFKQTRNRKIVGFTQELLDYTSSKASKLYYVSKREVNLFALLCNSMQQNQIPNGPLILTSFIKWYNLLKPNKPTEHKHNAINTNIQSSTNTSYIRIGDDTQGDMEVYLKIIQNHKNKICFHPTNQTFSQRFATN